MTQGFKDAIWKDVWKITVLTLPEVCIFWNDTKRKRLKNAFVSIVRVQVKKKKKGKERESQNTQLKGGYIYKLQFFNNCSDKVVRGIPIDK